MKEENVLFSILITLYLQIQYSVGHMVKDHMDSERGTMLLPLHELLFSISSTGSFICTILWTG